MSEPEHEAHKLQREAEHDALRHVRGALDEIRKKEEDERKLKRRILLAAPVILVAFVAGGALLLRTVGRRRHPEPHFVEPDAHAIAVRNRIARNVIVPAGVPDSAQAVVRLSISEKGDLIGTKITTSSGFATYDAALLKAIERARSFPILVTQENVAKPSNVELVFRAK